MPVVTPSPDLADRLAPIELDTAGGGRVRIGSLWAERTVVLVHLRHFG